MKKKFITVTILLLFFSFSNLLYANDNFNEKHISKIEDIIKNYILNNPEIILESVERLRNKEAKKAEHNKKLVLENFKDSSRSAIGSSK